MATVTIFGSEGVRTITFEGDPDPAVTSVEADRVLQKIKDLTPCPSCTFLVDASNGHKKLTFKPPKDPAASSQKQPAVKLQGEAPELLPVSPQPGGGAGEVPTLRYLVGELLASGVVVQHPT